MNKYEKCQLVQIKCVKNKKSSINNGENEYLGFDFYFRKSESVKMALFTKKCLEEYGLPTNSIHIVSDEILPEDKINTKKDVILAIEKEAPYYKSLSISKIKVKKM